MTCATLGQMPKACKEVFHPCSIETMHITIFLLDVTEFLTTNIWYGSMDAALVGAIMSTHCPWEHEGPFASEIITSAVVPGIRSQIHTMFPRFFTSTVTIYT